MDDAWMTPDELSALIKVPIPTIYTWRARKSGPPAVRIGKHLRYRRTAVDAWLAARETPASAA